MDNFIIGETIICYDSRIWNKRRKDIDENKDCWKEAVIKNIRTNVKCCENTDNEHIHNILFDVRFIHDNYFSKGHFLSSIRKKKINKSNNVIMCEWELAYKDRFHGHFSFGVMTKTGEIILKDIMDKKLAEHIVEAHNYFLRKLST